MTHAKTEAAATTAAAACGMPQLAAASPLLLIPLAVCGNFRLKV